MRDEFEKSILSNSIFDTEEEKIISLDKLKWITYTGSDIEKISSYFGYEEYNSDFSWVGWCDLTIMEIVELLIIKGIKFNIDLNIDNYETNQ